MSEALIPVLNAHAGGGWRGVAYTNSKEAFEHSYKIGFRNIEVDVALTSDDEFVVRHGTGFREKYTKVDFLRGGAYKTSLTVDDVLAFMKVHQDVHVMFDFHPGLFNRNCPEEVKRFAQRLMKSAGEGISRRILIEVYSKANALALLGTGFRNVIFGWMDGHMGRVDFAPPPPPLDEFEVCMRFCSENGIRFVSIPASHVRSKPSDVAFAKELGLMVYSCGWQTMKALRFAKKTGVDVATVDFLCPGGGIKNVLCGLERIFWMNMRELRGLLRTCI